MLTQETENRIIAVASNHVVARKMRILFRWGRCIIDEPGWKYINQSIGYCDIKATLKSLNALGMKPGRNYTVEYRITPEGVVIFELQLKSWAEKYRFTVVKNGKEVL